MQNDSQTIQHQGRQDEIGSEDSGRARELEKSAESVEIEARIAAGQSAYLHARLWPRDEATRYSHATFTSEEQAMMSFADFIGILTDVLDATKPKGDGI